MGHIVAAGGISPDPEKVKAVCEMPAPTDVAGVQRFLGMVTYMAKFVPGLAEKTAGLRVLTEKGVIWHWEEQQEMCFEEIKGCLTSAPVLGYFSNDREITISTDASSKGVGCVLLQEGKPVAFASKSLTETQRRWAQIEKEMYAIVVACEKFHDFVYGQPEVTVESDHLPLISIAKKPLHDAPMRLQKMLLRLQKYSLNIVHKPGKELVVADTLSRAFLEGPSVSKGVGFDVHMIEVVPCSEGFYSRLQEETAADAQLQQVKTQVALGWPDQKAQCLPMVGPFWDQRAELSCYDNILFRGSRIVIPKTLQKDMLTKIHSSHQGMQKCKSRARESLFWPGMNADIENVVSRCTTCQDFRPRNGKEPLLQHSVPYRPWAKAGVDLFCFKGRDYLLCVDYYSKFPEIQLLGDKTSQQSVQALKSIFARHGIPECVVTDNGPCFASAVFKKFSKAWGFDVVYSSPLHSQSNGRLSLG